LRVLCVVTYRSLRRADHWSRGVLLSAVCLSVIVEPPTGGLRPLDLWSQEREGEGTIRTSSLRNFLKLPCTSSPPFFYKFGLGSSSALLPPGSTAASVAYARGLLYYSPLSNRSYSGRQVPLASTTRGSPLAARGETMGEKWWPDSAWDMYPGLFYMPQICDMGPIILLPLRRKAC
jgi:hypothetical protein